MIEQGSKVYVQGWTNSVFGVSMLLPADKVAVASWPLTEPGVRGDELRVTPHGYRPIIVTEGERGFCHQGNEAAGIQPWYLSRDFETAKRQVDDWNTELGISKAVAMEIVAESFASND
ncbi:hypothetical protein I0C86_41130 [Plantactinospora sp. S1510]|uniref:Uncharacterized protein n=1 Tax=Plantactinospora alkalitolerans TaxID=2789879 RepID=A0ABS0HAE7_9ACTN|nr:hypothetical protein [Plantactinospora alkalitolerans]MBF9135256.1 hypothetical protein [Plantactinospora alkalitolerans]